MSVTQFTQTIGKIYSSVQNVGKKKQKKPTRYPKANSFFFSSFFFIYIFGKKLSRAYVFCLYYMPNWNKVLLTYLSPAKAIYIWGGVSLVLQEKFEDVKGVIRTCKSKGIHYNEEKKDSKKDKQIVHKTLSRKLTIVLHWRIFPLLIRVLRKGKQIMCN